MNLDTDNGIFTPSQASILLTLALVKILGEEELAEPQIGNEASAWLADWPYRATNDDKSRVVLIEEDEGGKLFRYITDELMPAVSNDIASVAASRVGELTCDDMVVIETFIAAESAKRRRTANVQAKGGPVDDSPYC